MKTKKQNIWKLKRNQKQKYNNGKQIELGQIIKFKTNGKIWGRMQTESKNIGKTTTYTHFRIFRFPIFDTHPRLSFIRFQFYHFSILWFAIPNFDFQIFDTFKIHVSIIHLSTCRFSFSAFWCLISGFRFTLVWHFTNNVSFCVFSIFRFHIYSFWYSMSNFRISDVHSETQEEVPSSPKKQTEPAQTNPKPSGLILSVTARGMWHMFPGFPISLAFKPYCTRLCGPRSLSSLSP